MNLKLKETLAKILTRLNPSVLTTTWSGVAPTMSASKVVASITLKSNSKYLVLAYNGNGIGGSAACNVNFACAGASKLLLGPGYTNDGYGNPCSGWAYVETGSSGRTFQVNSYGYNSAAKFTGSAVAIPIMGGGNT